MNQSIGTICETLLHAIANKVRDERDKETSLQVCKQNLAEQVEFNFAQVINYDS